MNKNKVISDAVKAVNNYKPYCDTTDKDNLHRKLKTYLKLLASELNLDKSTYEIRSNKAGIAVSGEVTLHHDKFYVQINAGTMMGKHNAILYRSCQGRKDYSGGINNFCSVEQFDNLFSWCENKVI